MVPPTVPGIPGQLTFPLLALADLRRNRRQVRRVRRLRLGEGLRGELRFGQQLGRLPDAADAAGKDGTHQGLRKRKPGKPCLKKKGLSKQLKLSN